ncbi:MAG: rhombotarget lipoprotein [Xanthomonadales bacterium]|nr:rhombotarget lipoprotein [Xanthomonadales bacterium]
MKIRIAGLLWISVLFLSACSMFFANNMRSGSSSSLVDYLYPGGEIPPPVENVLPEIKLPARVGLAFVPSAGFSQISDAEQTQLLTLVQQSFADRDFIETIQVIPSTYLRGKGGFTQLEQVGRLYSVDIIALVSYDQVIRTADTTASLLYWTIVGAYVIKGSTNDITTFVDTAVFDLATRRMLFRAPGINESSGKATAVGLGQASRDMSTASFEAAIAQMNGNLHMELDKFRERVRQGESARLVNRDGSPRGGAGSADGLLLLLGLLGMFFIAHSRNK